MNSQILKNKIFFPLFFLPLTYILGVAVVEFFLFSYLFFLFFVNFNKELLNKKVIIILFLFSFYVGINALIQIPSNLKYSSIFHFRYVFFSIAVFFFFEKYSKIKINKKLITILFSIIIIFLLCDSIFQFFVGENIFGQKILQYRVSSFFGDDLILGSYLIRLLPIIIWYLFYLRIDVNLRKFYFIIFFSIYFIVIYLSGERTSFALLIAFIFLSFLFINELRQILSKSVLIFFIFILVTVSIPKNIINKYGVPDIADRMFNKTVKQITKTSNIKEKKSYKNNDDFITLIRSLKVFSQHHQGHLIVAKNLFRENIIFGVGPKGFRHFCRVVDYDPKEGICSTHPHNILAQTLSELGLIGFLFYLTFLIFFIKNFFIVKNKKINKFELNSFLIISIGILVHLIPILPSGNFFNNWISSFIYFKIGLLLYSHKKVLLK